jgi:LuxR family maltose regulon positive regulatory protein
VLAVAVFAVPDRYSGAQAALLSLVVLAGGFAPVAVFAYLFRDYLQPSRGSGPSATPTGRRGTPRGAEGRQDVLVEPMTERELEVLDLVAQGLSNKEIAVELSVSVSTVKTHTNNINRKLGTRTRTQAIAAARRLQLL